MYFVGALAATLQDCFRGQVQRMPSTVPQKTLRRVLIVYSKMTSETGKGVNTPSFGRGIPALVIEPLDTASVEERAVGEKGGEWPYCRKGSSDTSAGRGLESLAPRPAFTLLGN